MKASDGMWDVINVETVRRLVMKFESPEEVAIALAQSASNLRAAHNVRRDDITVMVIDINPHVYYDHYTSSKCVIV
jgi:serine/threonine protein phosphatase PrpC